jgi:hypothetical protein
VLRRLYLGVPVISALKSNGFIVVSFTVPGDGGVEGPPPERQRNEDLAYRLTAVYAFWVTVVLLLFPACLWFRGFEAESNAVWVSYL